MTAQPAVLVLHDNIVVDGVRPYILNYVFNPTLLEWGMYATMLPSLTFRCTVTPSTAERLTNRSCRSPRCRFRPRASRVRLNRRSFLQGDLLTTSGIAARHVRASLRMWGLIRPDRKELTNEEYCPGAISCRRCRAIYAGPLDTSPTALCVECGHPLVHDHLLVVNGHADPTMQFAALGDASGGETPDPIWRSPFILLRVPPHGTNPSPKGAFRSFLRHARREQAAQVESHHFQFGNVQRLSNRFVSLGEP